MNVILALGKWRQKDQEFKPSINYISSGGQSELNEMLSQNTNPKKKRKKKRSMSTSTGKSKGLLKEFLKLGRG